MTQANPTNSRAKTQVHVSVSCKNATKDYFRRLCPLDEFNFSAVTDGLLCLFKGVDVNINFTIISAD